MVLTTGERYSIGKIFGFLCSYFVFTAIFHLILSWRNWASSYSSTVGITMLVVLGGLAVRKVLK